MRNGLIMVLAVSVPGACYDPDLGDNPFLCANQGDRCPKGYLCVKSPKARNTHICVKEGTKVDLGVPDRGKIPDGVRIPSKEGPIFIDGAFAKDPKDCLDKESEPNNSADKATDLTKSATDFLPDWQICYPGDVDQFQIHLDEGDKLMITVTFEQSKGDLDAALFDPDGVLVDAARSETDDEQVSLTAATKKGKYVLGVWCTNPTLKPTYDLTVKRVQR